ncbi:MAG: aminotransferase class IV family protein [Luteimonas sp.]|nr:aminotransferase class IV family protein [Luteimonas sp.]
MNLILCNGRRAKAADLVALAMRNHGHFTTMQVRDGAVRGLDLHLARLREATAELFDAPLDDARVLGGLRQALDIAGTGDCTARVSVCAREFESVAQGVPLAAGDLDVVVALTPPAEPAATPMHASSFEHERSLPHIKHVGTFAQFHVARQARGRGYDDVLFVGADGRISEGTVWNVGFWDGSGVTWPDAPALRGTCEQLLQAGLETLGVAQARRGLGLADLPGFQAAFACNSRGVRAIGAVDKLGFAADPGLLALLGRALATHPWQPVLAG